MLTAKSDKPIFIRNIPGIDTIIVDHSFPDYYIYSEPEPQYVNKNLFGTGERNEVKKHYSPDEVMSGKNLPGNTVSSHSYEAYLMSGDTFADSETVSPAGSDLLMGVLLLSLVFLAVVKVFFERYLEPVFASVFSYKISLDLFRDKNINTRNTLFFLQIIFLVNSGLFLLLAFDFFGINPFPPGFGIFGTFMLCIAVAGLLYFSRIFLIRVTGFLFDRKKIFSEYIHNISLFAKSYGILLFPFIAGMMYAPESWRYFFVYGGLAAAGLYYLAQVPRGIKLLQNKEFSVFYLFLYLCTVEIIPLIIAFRYFNTHLVN